MQLYVILTITSVLDDQLLMKETNKGVWYDYIKKYQEHINFFYTLIIVRVSTPSGHLFDRSFFFLWP